MRSLSAILLTAALLSAGPAPVRSGTPMPPLHVPSGCCAAAPVLVSCFGFSALTDNSAFLTAALACKNGAAVLVDRVAGSAGVWPTLPVSVPSDTVLLIDAGVTLQALRGAYHDLHSVLLSIGSTNNVTVEGLGGAAWTSALQMWQTDYANSSQYAHSEWRHAVAISGSSGVTLRGLLIEQTGGDCVYISSSSSNISLLFVNLNRGFRNAVSVTGVDGLLIQGSFLQNAGGTCCESGIDFEPEIPAEKANNVIVRDTLIQNNGMNQVTLSLYGQDGVVDDILFDNVTIGGEAASGLAGIQVAGYTATSPLGTLRIVNSLVRNTKDYGLKLQKAVAGGQQVIISNTTFLNTATSGHWPINVNGGGLQLANVTFVGVGKRPFLYGGWRGQGAVFNISGSATVHAAGDVEACEAFYSPGSANNTLCVNCVN